MTRRTTWFMHYDEVKKIAIRLNIELIAFVDGSFEAHATIEEWADNWDEPRYHFYNDDLKNKSEADAFVKNALNWGKRYGMTDNDFTNIIWSVKEGN